MTYASMSVKGWSQTQQRDSASSSSSVSPRIQISLLSSSTVPLCCDATINLKKLKFEIHSHFTQYLKKIITSAKNLRELYGTTARHRRRTSNESGKVDTLTSPTIGNDNNHRAIWAQVHAGVGRPAVAGGVRVDVCPSVSVASTTHANRYIFSNMNIKYHFIVNIFRKKKYTFWLMQ